MNLTINSFLPIRSRCLPLLEQLGKLFQEMDQAYDAIAAQYGFECTGCADNCCLTRFYHHTLLEYLYLVEGIRTLHEPLRQKIRNRSLSVNAKTAQADGQGDTLRIMCPLNRNGRCMLYSYRPMICRLHGIPHELNRPGAGITKTPGCDAFFKQCKKGGKTEYIPFDRTPFYRQMAALEKAFRQSTGCTDKIRITIAQMLVTITDDAHEID